MSRRPIAGLYAIADTSLIAADRLSDAVSHAIAGGARVIQYRDKFEKAGDSDERVRLVRALAVLCRRADVCFIVNDDPELAAAAGADGVHIGRDDPEIAKVRERLGPQSTIGVSCYNELERALAAEAAGADYVAFGSFYPSPTKPRAVRADTGLLGRARARLRLPLVAIGGINPENGARLIAAGASALAVISGVFAQRDIEAAACRYAQLFEHEPHEANRIPT